MELVAYAINLLLTGATPRGSDPSTTPLEAVKDARLSYHYIATGQQAFCGDSMGNFWTGQNVFSSGNLKLDLLHNFFLECGARGNKIRVYEMAKEPTARALTGFLLVRGGVHIVAYAKALEKLSGVAVGKLLPIPDISNKRFPESKRHEDAGLHRILYRFSPAITRAAAKSGTANTRKTASRSKSPTRSRKAQRRPTWPPSRN